MFSICAKNILGIWRCFHYCLAEFRQHEVFSAPCFAPPVRRLGEHRHLGTQPGQLTPADHRNIPCLMLSCSAHKAGRGEGREDI